MGATSTLSSTISSVNRPNSDQLNQLIEENDNLRSRLRAEIVNRQSLEFRVNELTGKLLETKKGLQETSLALHKVQIATTNMITKKDYKENYIIKNLNEQISSLLEKNKNYENEIMNKTKTISYLEEKLKYYELNYISKETANSIAEQKVKQAVSEATKSANYAAAAAAATAAANTNAFAPSSPSRTNPDENLVALSPQIESKMNNLLSENKNLDKKIQFLENQIKNSEKNNKKNEEKLIELIENNLRYKFQQQIESDLEHKLMEKLKQEQEKDRNEYNNTLYQLESQIRKNLDDNMSVNSVSSYNANDENNQINTLEIKKEILGEIKKNEEYMKHNFEHHIESYLQKKEKELNDIMLKKLSEQQQILQEKMNSQIQQQLLLQEKAAHQLQQQLENNLLNQQQNQMSNNNIPSINNNFIPVSSNNANNINIASPANSRSNSASAMRTKSGSFSRQRFQDENNNNYGNTVNNNSNNDNNFSNYASSQESNTEQENDRSSVKSRGNLRSRGNNRNSISKTNLNQDFSSNSNAEVIERTKTPSNVVRPSSQSNSASLSANPSNKNLISSQTELDEPESQPNTQSQTKLKGFKGFKKKTTSDIESDNESVNRPSSAAQNSAPGSAVGGEREKGLSSYTADELLEKRKLIKKNIYVWTKKFKLKNNRDPTSEEKEEQVGSLYKKYKAISGQLKKLGVSLDKKENDDD